VKGALTIYRRELAGLFLTPLGWVLFCLALLLNGYFFFLYASEPVLAGGDVDVALSLALGQGWPYWLLMVVLPPLLTMRMISEESRSGMLEFLLTAPVRDGAVVVGKALAATTFLGLLWLCCAAFGLLCEALGASPDWGQVVAALIGSWMVSALFASVGLVASALSSTPMLAAFLGLVFNVVLILPRLVAERLANVDRELADAVLRKVDFISRFQSSFMTGALDSSDVVFFAAWTGVFLFLATLRLSQQRWL